MWTVSRVVGCVGVAAAAWAAGGLAEAATLVSHYTFDSDAGNAVAGSPDGTLMGGATIAGGAIRGSGALSLNGTSAYVDATSGGFPNSSAAYYSGTVAMWVKANPGAATSSVRFMGVQNGSPPFGSDNRMSLDVGTNAQGGIQFFIRSLDSRNLKFRHEDPFGVYPTTWANGEWHHLAFSWAVGPAGTISSDIYIDGLPVPSFVTESGMTSADNLGPWTRPLAIGAFNNRDVIQSYFNGMMDDVRVYDGVLTDAEVLALVVPEPASVGLLALGAVAAVARRRR